MGDLANIQIGRQNLKYGAVDLGHTDGGCEFSYEPEYTDIVVDAYGKTVADKVLIGEAVKVKVPMAEVTLDRLKMSMPTGTLIGTTTKKLTIGSAPGKKLSGSAQILELHPAWLDVADKTFDIVLHKAVIIGEVKLAYKADEKTIIEVEFLALIDESKTDGNYLATIGDPTAV